MSITTLDQALAGMMPPRMLLKASSVTPIAGNVGVGFSLWPGAGSPGAGAYDTTLNGVVLSSSSAMVNGQIPHVDPGSGNSYLARLAAAASQPMILYLCDRLWHNGGFTITATTAQTITSPTFPARDNAATTNGDGVQLALEVSATVGAAAPNISVSYTNQAGTAAHTAQALSTGLQGDKTFNSAVTGTFYRLGLQAGDTGVRSVQSMTLSASQVSGTVNLVAYRVLAALELSAANIPAAIDALTAGFPRLVNGVVPFLMCVPGTAAAIALSGTYTETQG